MALTRGRIANPPKILEARSLTREDLAILRQPRAVNVVAKLRDTHHRVARLIASGLRVDDVVEISGYSYQRVWTLTKDPAFQELVAQYRGKVDAAFEKSQDVYFTTATANMLKAENLLSERLDEALDGEVKISTRDLAYVSGERADRFGYGKKNTIVHDNIGSALEKAIARSGKAVTIDAKANSPTPSPALASMAPADGNPANPTPQGPVSLKSLALARRGT